MAHWFAMGGYAIYVWPAFAVFFAVLAWDWFVPAWRRRRLTRELRGKLARQRTRNERAARAEVST
jgi:heme exporter protein D